MPRGPREVEVDWPYHVVIRGNNRRRIFSYKSDYEKFLWLLRDASRKVECPIHSVGMLSNHAHLLVRPQTEDAMALLMKSTLQRYTQWRNRQRNATGKLFEQRYYSKRIENDKHFGCTQAYAETNPRRAGILKPEYDWSTLGLFTGQASDALRERFEGWITPSSWYLDLGPSAKAREKAYRRWVRLTLEGKIAPAHIADLLRLENPPVGRIHRPDGSAAW
ncbi:MAG: transposase [Deltaproteobacteria bacterium]|nr:transposase [Deltaproteobacteria bacterium]